MSEGISQAEHDVSLLEQEARSDLREWRKSVAASFATIAASLDNLKETNAKEHAEVGTELASLRGEIKLVSQRVDLVLEDISRRDLAKNRIIWALACLVFGLGGMIAEAKFSIVETIRTILKG